RGPGAVRGAGRRGLPRRLQHGRLPLRVTPRGARRDRPYPAAGAGDRRLRAPPRRARRPLRLMTVHRIAVLPGDGIGPEVIAAGLAVLRAAGERHGLRLDLVEYPMGAAGVAAHGDPFPKPTADGVVGATAVLLGAVGDPSLDSAPRHLKPETGLLALRARLGVFANLRPVAIHPALVHSSPLRP